MQIPKTKNANQKVKIVAEKFKNLYSLFLVFGF
jgi:hypothetical protein